MRLTVDLRMYRHSGIGRYLQNVFSRALPLLQATSVRILGDPSLFADAAWLADRRLQLYSTAAPIYSLAEQALSLRGAFSDSDLVWIPHYNAPLLLTTRTVVTIHDMAPIAVPLLLDSALKRACARLLIERSVSHASAILCPSDFTRRELLARLNVASAKISVTPLGLDVQWPQHSEAHMEPDRTPYLLFVGNIKPNKNLRVLLQAFTQLADRLPLRLLLVGRISGFRTGDPAALRQAESLGDRVRLLGEVSDRELHRLYAGAHALVFPSLYEGFGLPLLEAMQLGCPVLAANSSSLPEVAGDAALYFDPNSSDSLAGRLLESLVPARMDNLRALGRERVHQFSFDRCAQQTAAVLNRCLQETP